MFFSNSLVNQKTVLTVGDAARTAPTTAKKYFSYSSAKCTEQLIPMTRHSSQEYFLIDAMTDALQAWVG
jgi:hypothetical protein